jgi:hypothetical protein
MNMPPTHPQILPPHLENPSAFSAHPPSYPTGYMPPPQGAVPPPSYPTGYMPPPQGVVPPPSYPTGYMPPPQGAVPPPSYPTGYMPPPQGAVPPPSYPTGYMQPPPSSPAPPQNPASFQKQNLGTTLPQTHELFAKAKPPLSSSYASKKSKSPLFFLGVFLGLLLLLGGGSFFFVKWANKKSYERAIHIAQQRFGQFKQEEGTDFSEMKKIYELVAQDFPELSIQWCAKRFEELLNLELQSYSRSQGTTIDYEGIEKVYEEFLKRYPEKQGECAEQQKEFLQKKIIEIEREATQRQETTNFSLIRFHYEKFQAQYPKQKEWCRSQIRETYNREAEHFLDFYLYDSFAYLLLELHEKYPDFYPDFLNDFGEESQKGSLDSYLNSLRYHYALLLLEPKESKFHERLEPARQNTQKFLQECYEKKPEEFILYLILTSKIVEKELPEPSQALKHAILASWKEQVEALLLPLIQPSSSLKIPEKTQTLLHSLSEIKEEQKTEWYQNRYRESEKKLKDPFSSYSEAHKNLVYKNLENSPFPKAFPQVFNAYKAALQRKEKENPHEHHDLPHSQKSPPEEEVQRFLKKIETIYTYLPEIKEKMNTANRRELRQFLQKGRAKFLPILQEIHHQIRLWEEQELTTKSISDAFEKMENTLQKEVPLLFEILNNDSPTDFSKKEERKEKKERREEKRK